ncbi:MAG: cytochrome C [Actinobacteria bacterium]|nr:cytochrome C [Actinomycetota bacterium]
MESSRLIDRILGPRVPRAAAASHPDLYQRPRTLFTAAAIALGVSIMLPYWELRLKAPQFPKGLRVTAWVNRLEGDVHELEGLNHYIGIPSFEDGAVLERSVAIVGILVLAGLLLAGLHIHSRWVMVFVGPAVLFPLFFLADLQFWLWKYGHSLDPRAPLSGAVGEFTPPIFGPGRIAQFDTFAWPGFGLLLAVVAAGLAGRGLVAHRRAYRPLMLGPLVESDEGAPIEEVCV